MLHGGVRAERDQHGQPADPPVERAVHRRQQQRQRAAAGAVRHDDANAAPVQVGAGELLVDERAHLVVGENLVGAADPHRILRPLSWGAVQWSASSSSPDAVRKFTCRITVRSREVPRQPLHGNSWHPIARATRRLQAGRHDTARAARAAPGPAASARAGSARDRPPAVRGGPRRADRLPARARRPAPAPRRRSVHGPGDAAGHPGPLRDPAAARQRRPVGRPRCGPGSAGRGDGPRGVAAVVHALGGVPRYPGAVLAGLRAGGDLRRVGAALGADRGHDLRPDRRPARPRRPTGPARCTSGSASRCWPPPTTRATTWRRTPRWPRTPPGPAGSIPTFRPDRVSRAGRSRAGPSGCDGSARQPDVDTGALRRLRARAGGAPALLRRPRRDLRRPQPRRRPHRPAGAGGGVPHLHRRHWPAQATSRRDGRVPPAHAAGDGADVLRRRPGDDAAPGRMPRPPRPTARPVRRRTPATTSRCGSSSPTRCARCSSATAPIRTCTWCCSPSTRRCSPASSRRWPASTRRCTSARPGGSSTPPTRSAVSAPRSPRRSASPGRPGSSTTPARSARSRPATTCPAASTRASSPTWSPSTASTRTRRSRRAVDLVTTRPRAVFKL